MLTIDEFYSKDDIKFDLALSHGNGNPHFIAAVGLLTALHLCGLKRGRDDERCQELLELYRSQYRRLNAAERQRIDRYESDLHERYPLNGE